MITVFRFRFSCDRVPIYFNGIFFSIDIEEKTISIGALRYELYYF